MTLGIDLEQFVTDPYGTGIQRVLHQLALHWPDEIPASFIVPMGDRFAMLTCQQASQLLALAFEPAGAQDDLRVRVRQYLDQLKVTTVALGELLALHDGWFLPEVSYLPSVLQRLEIFARCVPTTMIGYDVLPMTEPGNYRFAPGTAAMVSQYFRMLATVDRVVAISEYARSEILDVLRRDRGLVTVVAHPGADHVTAVRSADRAAGEPVRFLRVGTMEARKQPRELVEAFCAAVDAGAYAELIFVGRPSASDSSINRTLEQAIEGGYPIRWVRQASDEQVYRQMAEADLFLSFGTEGYGIPVLEALVLGTPVIYDGIQPAAALMEGKGALWYPAVDPQALSGMFTAFADRSAVRALHLALGQSSVPTWQRFVSTVAQISIGRAQSQ